MDTQRTGVSSNKRRISPTATTTSPKRPTNQDTFKLVESKKKTKGNLKFTQLKNAPVLEGATEKWTKNSNVTPGHSGHVTGKPSFAAVAARDSKEKKEKKEKGEELPIHESDVILRFNPRITRDEALKRLLNELPFKPEEYTQIFCKFSGVCIITMASAEKAKALSKQLIQQFVKQQWPDLVYTRKWIEDNIPIIFSHVPAKFPDNIITEAIKSLGLTIKRTHMGSDTFGIQNGKRYYFVERDAIAKVNVPKSFRYKNYILSVYHPGQIRDTNMEEGNEEPPPNPKPQNQPNTPSPPDKISAPKPQNVFNPPAQPEHTSTPKPPNRINPPSQLEQTSTPKPSIALNPPSKPEPNSISPPIPPRISSTPTNKKTLPDLQPPLIIDTDEEKSFNEMDEVFEDSTNETSLIGNYTYPSAGYTYH